MPSIRRALKAMVEGAIDQINALVVDVTALALAAFLRMDNVAKVSGAIGNGSTAGRLRTTAAITFGIGGALYTKASTDDLWNLSAQTDTTAGQYRAFWLYLDSSGTASIAAGTNAASAALAIAALPAITTTKSVIGVYVAGPSTDFDAAGGLAAQGTTYNGFPAAGALSMTSASITLVAP